MKTRMMTQRTIPKMKAKKRRTLTKRTKRKMMETKAGKLFDCVVKSKIEDGYMKELDDYYLKDMNEILTSCKEL